MVTIAGGILLALAIFLGIYVVGAAIAAVIQIFVGAAENRYIETMRAASRPPVPQYGVKVLECNPNPPAKTAS